ncbi:GIY-YIG nuclease family protein [Candidatus Falkowbacteria bacterium]|nr:GIY-YIG nuclease family protein [Candidatus Falkowbacteria bacterium]
MYIVYILKSKIKDRYYTGHTDNLIARLLRHNKGLVKSTKHFKPWEVVYIETHKTKSEAYRRELEIKSYKGGILFKRLVGRFDKIPKNKINKRLLKY